MNRLVLSRFIRSWIVAAVPALTGCPFAGGDCPMHVHRVVAIAASMDPGDMRLDDAGVSPAGDAGSGADCASFCRTELMLADYQTVISCAPIGDGGGTTGIDCLITVPCEGRRPESLASDGQPAGEALVGRYFARMAHLEEASVTAFEYLAEELAEHGAPDAMQAAARRSAVEEERHTRVASSLARRHGAVPARAAVGPRRSRSLEELATENAVEGCVRETYGAVAATFQSMAASDRAIRSAMKRIAVDETRHAELAWSIARWAESRLTPAAAARVALARRLAAESLAVAIETDPPAELIASGVPPRATARALFAAMRADLGV